MPIPQAGDTQTCAAAPACMSSGEGIATWVLSVAFAMRRMRHALVEEHVTLSGRLPEFLF